MDTTWDCIVVGGGAAGLSAALVLGRARRRTLLGDGDGGLHRALLLRRWSDDLVLLSDGPAELEAGDRERLSAAGVEVDERPVARLIARDGALDAIEFADGSTLERDGLLVPVTVAQRSALAAQLGAEPAEPGPVAVDPLVVDAMFRTTAQGVSAAGDVSARMQQVAGAISAGSLAAVGVVPSLMAEDHGLEAPPLPARTAA